ncbi:cytosolic endo-beta-N-acetylglucosaminidase 1 [Impatiens glandulifera]|uniref:cytosolic endo-beta-N-acetylglucosaminidase 1 n=1 Tax=Impatiens glandulifera TaxID=253017 RepID=UPI001FB09D56|nr:cytosolic endo-beta-N-acetylglucosaminidase 1 [Impatiens glandulifera]
MQIPFRSYIKRETLVTIRNLLRSIYINLIPSSPMAAVTDSPSDSDPPQFDPSKPSAPISYPIKTLDDLASRSYFNSFHFPFNRTSVALPAASVELADRPRILVCHDMAGGYLDDKWIQGGENADAYAIWQWYLMDIFVYFSHNLVTLPPPCWTNAAHKHGVKVLGTFILEWDEGKIIAKELFSTKESAHMYADRLTELAVSLGFDGWLINMEVGLEAEKIPFLKEFVGHLAETMHSSMQGSQVIWYDSVTVDGDLSWQDQLNKKNKPFFDLCDGIFVNYTWKEDYPKLSGVVAEERRFDVYMGIDVFGRGTFGGGQWNTNVALDVLKESNVSAAIFAPGWVYETNQPPDFQTAQNRWWSLVESSWGVLQNYPQTLPFYSNFDQGHGYHYAVDGTNVLTHPWNNISSQSFQPLLEFPEENSKFEVIMDFNGDSYSGGGNVRFRGTFDEEEDNGYFRARLFHGKIALGDSPIHVSYSTKSNGKSTSSIGLSFDLSMENEETISLLLVSRGSNLINMEKFSSRFDKVIMPRRVYSSEASPDWFIQESIILPQFAWSSTLTGIHAVCYDSRPGNSVQSKFDASLGHIAIKTTTTTTTDENSGFPGPDCWLVEGECIEWGEEWKELSVKLKWSLKEGNNNNDVLMMMSKYNIYVEKRQNEEEAVVEYVGLAEIGAYYVSGLSVPSGTRVVKFIVQACGMDGSCQKIDDSPSFEIRVRSNFTPPSSSSLKSFSSSVQSMTTMLFNLRGAPAFSPLNVSSASVNSLAPAATHHGISFYKRENVFLVCASKGGGGGGFGSGNRPISGVVFEPFEEVKKELMLVPTVPQDSLARHKFLADSEAAINEQINVEYNVSYVYHAMFAYFDRDNIALKGLARFCKESSEEERHHAERFMEYQNKRGGKVKLLSILMPLSEFDHAEKGDALYAMELALSLEKLTNEKLLNLHAVAKKNNDVQLTEFVETEFLEEQVESIKKIAEYVAQLRRVGKGHGVWHFDQMLLEEEVVV